MSSVLEAEHRKVTAVFKCAIFWKIASGTLKSRLLSLLKWGATYPPKQHNLHKCCWFEKLCITPACLSQISPLLNVMIIFKSILHCWGLRCVHSTVKFGNGAPFHWWSSWRWEQLSPLLQDAWQAGPLMGYAQQQWMPNPDSSWAWSIFVDQCGIDWPVILPVILLT